jgi:hypothetical protein
MQVLAVVPVQRLEQAKSRLAPALEPAARQALVRELAERTIRVLRSVPAVAAIGLLTPDPSLARLASRWGVRTLATPLMASTTPCASPKSKPVGCTYQLS